MTGSHVGRALFFARSLAFDAGGKKKSKTHSPPLLPLLSDLFLPFLRSLSPWRSPRPSSGEYLGIRCARAGSVGEGFSLFSLRCTQQHWRKRSFFSFWLAFLCSAVFLETRDTSAKVTSSLAFALVLHEKPSFMTSVSFRAGRREELEGMAVATSGRSELVERERKTRES